jgi:hypothetical protein
VSGLVALEWLGHFNGSLVGAGMALLLGWFNHGLVGVILA